MSNQTNIINDLSIVSKVPNKILNELIAKEMFCIGSAIHDALLNKEEITVLNIGTGTLSIDLATMQCKFIPNKELKSIIKKCLETKVDPIEYEIEQALIEKLLKLSEEVF